MSEQPPDNLFARFTAIYQVRQISSLYWDLTCMQYTRVKGVATFYMGCSVGGCGFINSVMHKDTKNQNQADLATKEE